MWKKEKHARRLQKRLQRHREELLIFLDNEEVAPDNNAGERGFRPVCSGRTATRMAARKGPKPKPP